VLKYFLSETLFLKHGFLVVNRPLPKPFVGISMKSYFFIRRQPHAASKNLPILKEVFSNLTKRGAQGSPVLSLTLDFFTTQRIA
jgi:hypothetical protein